MPDPLIIAIAGAVALLILAAFWFVPALRKYFKYAVIVVPGVFVLVVIFLLKSKNRDGKEQGKSEDLQDAVVDIKEKLAEVNMETAIKVSAAKAKDEVKVQELKEIKKIDDRKERLNRLAAMMR